MKLLISGIINFFIEGLFFSELNRTSLVMFEQKELLSSWQNNFERLNLTYIQKIEEITQSLEKVCISFVNK